ncbi:MAG: thioredoxin [Chlamydiae bacterium]|nr:thioredoxin [Chlamydiota bacterium]
MKELTANNFTKEIAKGLFLVDFFAVWCGPCRMLAPILEDVAEQLQGKATIAKVDIDKDESLAAQFDVSSVPTMIIFKDGKVLEKVIGLRDAKALKALVEKHL